MNPYILVICKQKIVQTNQSLTQCYFYLMISMKDKNNADCEVWLPTGVQIELT